MPGGPALQHQTSCQTYLFVCRVLIWWIPGPNPDAELPITVQVKNGQGACGFMDEGGCVCGADQEDYP